MNTSDSHSCVTHSLPNRKLEKISVCGMFLLSKMCCPVLRCHQKSGSVMGWAERIKINAMKTKTSSRRVDRMSPGSRLERAEISTTGSSVLIRLNLDSDLLVHIKPIEVTCWGFQFSWPRTSGRWFQHFTSPPRWGGERGKGLCAPLNPSPLPSPNGRGRYVSRLAFFNFGVRKSSLALLQIAS